MITLLTHCILRDASLDSLDFASKQNTLTPSLGSGGSSSRSTAPPEPNIDFELDVKVFIDSGKCVLHPKDTKEEDAAKKSGAISKSYIIHSYTCSMFYSWEKTHFFLFYENLLTY